ncbi:MAG: hypothetical protein WC851_05755 [Candidatus Shapirobacteria bacterium]
MSRTSKFLSLALVLTFMLACLPGMTTPTTPAPTATEVSATETPAIVPTATEDIAYDLTVKFAQYSPNGKHLVTIVSDNGGESWNLMLDGKVRDEDVPEAGPVVWSPESDAFVLSGPDGLCYYIGRHIGTIAEFCYEEYPWATAVSFVTGYQGEKVWFLYNGDIYSVTPDWSSQPVKFVTEDKMSFIDLAVTKHGYYLAATTDEGELVVFETNGKYVRTYDCANATWALDGNLACVTKKGEDALIMFVDITKPGQETTLNVKNLRPENFLYSPNASKLAFYYAGGVFWVRLSDMTVYYASNPLGLGFNHSWRPNTSYIVYDECVELICTTKEVVPATKNKWHPQ